MISGICTENVVIRDKDVNLRGASSDPTLDGIRGRLITTPALTVRGSIIATIRNLSFSNSLGQAVSIQAGANETLTSCRFENNGGIGLQVMSTAFVTADSLTFNANTGRSIAVSNAQFFCTGCDVSGNGFALVVTRGAVASLLDTVVTGGRGILAGDGGTSADIDCASARTSHPCRMNVSGVAAQAINGARATLFEVGDFTGQLLAEDAGTVSLKGARQTSAATNDADFFGRIVAEANLDVNPPTQSSLRNTNAAHFARVLVTDATVIQGAIQCTTAADAVLDGTVTVVQRSDDHRLRARTDAAAMTSDRQPDHFKRGSHMTFVATRIPTPIPTVSTMSPAAMANRASELERLVVCAVPSDAVACTGADSVAGSRHSTAPKA